MTLSELRSFSSAAFGHRYRLELLSALAMAARGEGVCLSLLADCCGVSASVYYPAAKRLQGVGMIVTSSPERSERRVLYAPAEIPLWTALRMMVEDLAVDVDLTSAARTWPAAP